MVIVLPRVPRGHSRVACGCGCTFDVTKKECSCVNVTKNYRFYDSVHAYRVKCPECKKWCEEVFETEFRRDGELM